MSNELKKQITPISGNKKFSKISLPKELVSDLRELINPESRVNELVELNFYNEQIAQERIS